VATALRNGVVRKDAETVECRRRGGRESPKGNRERGKEVEGLSGIT